MLKINNLHVSNKKKSILNGINLEIGHGEIHAIMGPNGSGKSTLSSVIAGCKDYNIDKGELLFENNDITNLSPEKRSHLGIFLSFQYPVEIPGISVINFIKTSINSSRRANGLDDIPSSEILKKIYNISSILNIEKKNLLRSLNENFSGGEKKINEILQMMILEPKLAILDETDSGLDIDALRIVSKGINKLKNKNNSILIITHYQRLLKYIIPDYVHVLYEGVIIKSGDKKLALKLEDIGYEWIKK